MRTDRKQQEMLQKFFKEETTWFPEHIGFMLCAYIFIGIPMLLLIVPLQAWEGDFRGTLLWMYFMEWMGISFYMRRFLQYGEGWEQPTLQRRKITRIYELLRYLPVSGKQLYIFVMGKVVRLCLWLTGISVFSQSVFAITLLHTFSAWNLLAPLFGSCIIPIGFVALYMRRH